MSQPPMVESHEVQLLQVDLGGRDDAHVDELAGLLDESERARAARFANRGLSQKYVISHGHLRLMLSDHLDIGPRDIRFVSNPHGKPELDPQHGSNIRFNLSHSGDKCLIAVSWGCEVGIDVERVRPMAHWRDIATRFFNPREAERLASLPAQLTTIAFFATWSRKEAYIKALGKGLALDLESFEVEVDPRIRAHLVWSEDPTNGPDQWYMQDIEVGTDYRAALVVEGQHGIASLRAR